MLLVLEEGFEVDTVSTEELGLHVLNVDVRTV